MSRPNRPPEPSVAERLFAEPYVFDFFQAVRLLSRLEPDRIGVGGKGLARQERVRFHALTSLSFPPSAIASLKEPVAPGDPPDMTVAFLGLHGPSGVLPRVYTELIMERLRAGDGTLAAFLDLFNHRFTSFFYRAWEKYRPAIALERGRAEDRFADALFALVGQGIPALRQRGAFPDAALLPISGAFAQRRRPVVVLEAILSDYFGRPISVEPFTGRWLRLEPDDRSRTTSGTLGGNNQLGLSLVVGAKVWDEQSKFRLRLGPLSLEQFRAFLPGTIAYRQLIDMTRRFVDSEFDFDVQLVLKAEEVPPCRLGSSPGVGPQLGRTAWLTSRPLEDDPRDAVFTAEV